MEWLSPYYAVGVWGLIVLSSPWWRKRAKDPLINLLRRLRIMGVAFGAAAFLLFLSLPLTPVLKTFGRPSEVSDITAAPDLLQYLQDYNFAIARTTDVLSLFMLLIVVWLLTALFSITAALRERMEPGVSVTTREIVQPS